MMPGMTNSSDHANTLSVMSRLSTKALPKMSKAEKRSSNCACSPSTSFRQKRSCPIEMLPRRTNCPMASTLATGTRTCVKRRMASG